MKKIFTLVALALSMMVSAEETALSNADIKDTNTATDVNNVITLKDVQAKGGVQTGSVKFETLTAMKLSGSREFSLTFAETVTISKVYLLTTSNKDAETATVTSGDGKTTYGTAPKKVDAYATIDITGAKSIKFSTQSNAVIIVEYTDNNADPVLKFSDNEITLTASAFDMNPSAKVTLTGKNLTNKSIFPINFTETEGLSVSPENIEVQADGTVNQEITISYAPTSPTAANMVELSIDVLDAQATLKVNYSCIGEEIPDVVSVDTEWDWSKASSVAEIKLTETSKPSKNDTILLADYPGIEHGVFNSRALYVCGEYLVRDGKYFQGGYIKFTTSVAGKVSVEFSNTGNRTKDEEIRYLYVNGIDTKVGSKVTTENVVAKDIEVEAGDVVLTWQMPSAAGANQYARVYKITFTEGGATAISNAAAELKAIKTIENGQLVIIKNGIRYNAAGAKL